MTLTDDEIVAAAQTALRVLDVEAAVGFWQAPAWLPVDRDHPEWAVLQVDLGTESVTPGVSRESDPPTAAFALLDALTDELTESATFRAVAFPRCPGHAHPASYGIERREIWLRCPQSGSEFRRVTL